MSFIHYSDMSQGYYLFAVLLNLNVRDLEEAMQLLFLSQPMLSFCAFDKGNLSLDLSPRTIETNHNIKDYS